MRYYKYGAAAIRVGDRMAAKTKRAKAKPKAARKTTRAKAKAPRRARRAKSVKPKGAARDARAAKMAAFSKTVLREEEEPVTVRSFVEAREGTEKSRALDVKTGAVAPSAEEQADEDVPEFTPAPAPKIAPLAGPLSIPKRKEEEEFHLARPSKRGKRAEPPTKEDFGKVELRMQRAKGDAVIGRATPDYLQRSFNKAKESGRVAGTDAQREPTSPKEESFEVTQDQPSGSKDASLLDFGDVEVAQQTRTGRKKLGRLDTDEETT